MHRVLITGVSGQDGSYLAESLLADGIEVHGTTLGADSIVDGVEIHRLDLSRPGLGDLVRRLRPDIVFNLAAVSSVHESWHAPIATLEVNATAVAELLAAAESLTGSGHLVRVVQASSAEMFGNATEVPQRETTPISPVSPYGAAKAYAHHLIGIYRVAGVWATSCILYNHESPRRPERFVTRKITRAVARIVTGRQDSLGLGTLEIRRDWGWAPDTVTALRLAAQAEAPDDFVIATGIAHSVRDFVQLAFEHVGIADWASLITVDDAAKRPADPSLQIGDASHARAILGWAPTVEFKDIVAMMVDADLANLESGEY